MAKHPNEERMGLTIIFSRFSCKVKKQSVALICSLKNFSKNFVKFTGKQCAVIRPPTLLKIEFGLGIYFLVYVGKLISNLSLFLAKLVGIKTIIYSKQKQGFLISL